MICPVCHKPHEDPPDLAGGRIRVCKACHPVITVRLVKGLRKPRTKKPAKPGSAGSEPAGE